MSGAELRPCACGADPDSLSVVVGIIKPLIQICCDECGRRGPEHDDPKDAIEAWNRRPAEDELLAALRDAPRGAVYNGREHFRRLAEFYDFESEGGPLRNCGEFTEALRCFEEMAAWIDQAIAKAEGRG